MGVGDQVITGKDEGGAPLIEAAKVTAAQIKKNYSSATFTLPNPSVDVDLLALVATAFDKNKIVHAILIRSDQNISVKFNANTEDSVPVDAGAPFPFSALEITKIFLSNNVANANVNIILV